jgi:hypothetical protein
MGFPMRRPFITHSLIRQMGTQGTEALEGLPGSPENTMAGGKNGW